MRRLLAVLALLLATLAWTPVAAAAPLHCRLADSRIDEASTLVDLGDVVVIANDSGDSARIFVVDPRTCRTAGVTMYEGDAVDVESMAPAGTRAVWVGDTGDNTGSRHEITVTRVPVRRGDHSETGSRYRLRYPDGAHDAESLVMAGGRLVVITKGLMGGHVYVAPRRLNASTVNRLRRIGDVDTWATDAAASSDGRWLLVRSYGDATLYAYPSMRAATRFALPSQRQGEGISIGPGGRVLVDSEGEHSVLRQVRVPRGVAKLLAPPRPRPTPTPTSTPAPAAEPASATTSDGSSTWLPWTLGGGAAVVVGVVLLAGLRRRRGR